MDGSLWATIFAGLSALLTAATGAIIQLRRTDPTNVKLLQERVVAAEDEVARLRRQLLTANAELFRFKQLAAQHGWLSQEEADEVNT